jgi:epoxyqueuosine reductase
MGKDSRGMEDIWLNWAKKKGYGVTFGDISKLRTVKTYIENKKRNFLFDKDFYKNWLVEFEHSDEPSMGNPVTLILLAIPKPAFKIPFTYKGELRTAILPPTYACYRPTFKQICNEARTEFMQEPYWIDRLSAPLKSLAVLTGLVKYGRNNITYHSEMGSYFQLVGLITNIPLEPESTPDSLDGENNLMLLCKTCQACLNACPTGAISKDRLLLHAERCYTLFSETSGKLSKWPLPPSPECLIGCMRCQMVCPMNKGKLRYETAPFSLSEEETDFMVRNFDPNTPLGDKINKKFSLLHLTKDYQLYIRNFQRLVKHSIE